MRKSRKIKQFLGKSRMARKSVRVTNTTHSWAAYILVPRAIFPRSLVENQEDARGREVLGTSMGCLQLVWGEANRLLNRFQGIIRSSTLGNLHLFESSENILCSSGKCNFVFFQRHQLRVQTNAVEIRRGSPRTVPQRNTNKYQRNHTKMKSMLFLLI